ncbi:transposase [Paraburkholderia mimosarum]|uniref:transposase n=1 Tax=Paraburkholderia mimosarum TaxID=312026 RepID=UPI0039C195C7
MTPWAPYAGALARRQFSNELWATLESLIPVFRLSPKGGRRRTVDDRAALNGMLYVMQTGIPWEGLAREFGLAAAWHAGKGYVTATRQMGRVHLVILRRLRERVRLRAGKP